MKIYFEEVLKKLLIPWQALFNENSESTNEEVLMVNAYHTMVGIIQWEIKMYYEY